MNDIVDTLINLEIFAFIGLLVWLYFRPVPNDGGNSASGAEAEPD